MRSAAALLLLSATLVNLAACGFSLRGSDVLSSRFERIQLQLQQPGSEFSRLLQRSLAAAEVETLDDTVAASAGLHLLQVIEEPVQARPVTINPRARAAQYELRLAVTINLALDGRVLLGPETLFVERTYFEDIENISGNQEEVEIISREMRRELVNQLMRRLQAVAS